MPLIFFFIVFFVAIVVVVVVVVAAALFVVVVDRHRRLTNRRPCSLSILLADLYNEFPGCVQTTEQKNMFFLFSSLYSPVFSLYKSANNVDM
jgi:hypothetical protein